MVPQAHYNRLQDALADVLVVINVSFVFNMYSRRTQIRGDSRWVLETVLNVDSLRVLHVWKSIIQSRDITVIHIRYDMLMFSNVAVSS